MCEFKRLFPYFQQNYLSGTAYLCIELQNDKQLLEENISNKIGYQIVALLSFLKDLNFILHKISTTTVLTKYLLVVFPYRPKIKIYSTDKKKNINDMLVR